MTRSLPLVLAALMAMGAGSALAAPCKDAKGKFIKCPAPPVSASHCRDKTTKKLAKCGAPNTEPLPMKAATPMATAKKAPVSKAKAASKPK